jgi:hypothetical protein
MVKNSQLVFLRRDKLLPIRRINHLLLQAYRIRRRLLHPLRNESPIHLLHALRSRIRQFRRQSPTSVFTSTIRIILLGPYQFTPHCRFVALYRQQHSGGFDLVLHSCESGHL